MKLYGVCTRQGPIFIVTELMVHGKYSPSLHMNVCVHNRPCQLATFLLYPLSPPLSSLSFSFPPLFSPFLPFPLLSSPSFSPPFISPLSFPGCLLRYLRQQKELIENKEVILDMTTQVCSAMKYLEANGFIHRALVSTDRNTDGLALFPGLARSSLAYEICTEGLGSFIT